MCKRPSIFLILARGIRSSAMRFLFLFSLFSFLFSSPICAQFTQVSATVTDPNGIPYGGATVSVTLVPTGGNPTLNGVPFSAQLTATADANGTFNLQLADNNIVLPGGTQWRFSVCETPGVAPPFGFGSTCFTSTQTITGASQSLTAALTAAAPALTRTVTTLYNVKNYGARGDGVTNDSVAFAAALAAAQANNGTLYVPKSSGNYILSQTMIVLRRTRVLCDVGATLKWPIATGTMFIFNSSNDPSVGSLGNWIPGGVENCSLQGNTGAGDTSRAIQIGLGAGWAYGMVFRDVDISFFGYGITFSGTAGAAGRVNNNLFIRVSIHENACDGIRAEQAGADQENTFFGGNIFGNGFSSATCTGINVGPSSFLTMQFQNTWIHSNNGGNGTLAQFQTTSTSTVEIHFITTHWESLISTAATSFIECLGACNLFISDSDFTQNGLPATTTKTAIKVGSGFFTLSNSSFNYNAGGSQTPLIDLGAGVAGSTVWAVLRNNFFNCANTSANCQVLTMTATGTNINFDITGSALRNFSAATSLINVVAGSTGCHDLGTLVNLGGPTGSRICTGRAQFSTLQLTAQTTGSIGGGALLAGQCATGTVTVTGVASSDALAVTPVTYPGASIWWDGYMSAANTVTVVVCAAVAATPTASNYNVRVIK